MTRPLQWFTAAALALVADAFLPGAPVAHACTCGPPDLQVWSPTDGEPAPLNARVTVLRRTRSKGELMMRPVGGEPIATSKQTFDAGWRTIVVLTPAQPLAPNTRYEVAFVQQIYHPTTLVFGTFETGDHRDSKAPSLAPLQQAVFHDQVMRGSTSCGSRERWLEIELSPARDDRAGAVLYGLWVADAQGKLDLKEPPLAIVPMGQTRLIFGGTDMCSAAQVPLPKRLGRLPFAVAAFDAAGNRSAAQRGVVTVPPPKAWP